MRKILISILDVLLLIGLIFLIVNGAGWMKVEGIKGLDEANKAVDKKISNLSNAISVTYVNSEANLKRAASTLQETKTEYENQEALSSTQNRTYVSNLEKYDIDYLWTKIGNYARDENVVIKMDLVQSGSSSNLYTLNFTVTGEYSSITNFIYDIENDSKLGFKIDEFKMGAADASTLSATFSCKEIPIIVGTVDQGSSSASSSTTSDSSSGTNQTSSSSSTQSTNTGASTNSTNTDSTNTNSTSTNSSATTNSSTSSSNTTPTVTETSSGSSR